MHKMKTSNGKGGLVGIKIDMSKAYDRVDWGFLLEVLRCYGFSEKVIAIIEQCVCKATSAILLNGSPFKTLHLERGLRQGDPLSPYLFIMVAEVLSRLLAKEESLGHFHGIKIGRRAPSISHLMFADDTILFCRAKVGEVKAVWNCVEKYQRWSGQEVNVSKSGLIFSKNCSMALKRVVGIRLGIEECSEEVVYLGNPLIIGRNKSKAFASLKKKVHDRLEGWMAKTISRAGRTTLVKSVIQSIPTYTMSTYKLPNTFCRSLDKMARKFWWHGRSGEGRFLALRQWELLCQPKTSGGLGFRRFEDTNMALMTKIGWNLATNLILCGLGFLELSIVMPQGFSMWCIWTGIPRLGRIFWKLKQSSAETRATWSIWEAKQKSFGIFGSTRIGSSRRGTA